MASTGSIGGWAVLECGYGYGLTGHGTSADPYQLGVVIGPVEVNCLAAASGAIDDYFSFTLQRQPGTGSYAGGTTDLAGGGIYATLLYPQGTEIQCPEIIGWDCGAIISPPPGSNRTEMRQGLHYLPAGTYLLHLTRTVTATPAGTTYAVWINPNYSDATPPLYPSGDQILLGCDGTGAGPRRAGPGSVVTAR
jgi:hypothetical protein